MKNVMRSLVQWMAILLMCVEFLSAEEVKFDLLKAFSSVQQGKLQTIDIPKGIYRLPAGGLVWRNWEGVTVNGNGSTFVATDLNSPAIQIFNGRGLILKNFKIEYDPLPFTQGTVTAVDLKAKTIDFRLHDGYPDLKMVTYKNGEPAHGMPRLHLFEAKAHVWKVGAPDYAATRVEALEGRNGRAYFPDWATGLEFAKPGDRVAIATLGHTAFEVRDGSDDNLFEDISVQSSPGLAFLIRSSLSVGTFRRVKVVPGPTPSGAKEERLISSNMDAFHVGLVREGPVLDECEFSYQGDDGVNLHGFPFPILKWYDDKSFLAVMSTRGNRIDQVTRAGDIIRFLLPPSYRLVADSVIEKVVMLENEPVEPWLSKVSETWKANKVNPSWVTFYRVTLKKPVPQKPEGVFCEVPQVAAPGFVIKNSYFHDHRARGLRIESNNGLILNNRFERLKGSAISLGAEFSYWREAGWCRNITIYNNSIKDVGEGMQISLPESYSMGAICVMVRSDENIGKDALYKGNENIVIEKNTIDGCSVNAIHVSEAREVKIIENEISRVNLNLKPDSGSKYGLYSDKPISVIRAEAEVRDNIIK